MTTDSWKRWFAGSSLIVVTLLLAYYCSTEDSVSSLRGSALYRIKSSKTPIRSNAEDPQVVWLMSFGGSGTSYTINNVERLTETTTATNYARDIVPNVPVQANWTNGPFLHKSYLPIPDYVLTKTHCGGYCMDCGLSGYYQSYSMFEQDCRTGTKLGDNAVTYADINISKAVHVIRNPFDNIVSRSHLACQHRVERGESPFNHSKEGFDEWCRYLDDKYSNENQRQMHLLDLNLPCSVEWYRYVRWHNHAAQFTVLLPPDVYYLYYENYTTNYDASVSELLEFMQLSPVGGKDPVPFMGIGKSYLGYYSTEHQQRAAQYVQRMATPEAWLLIKHYFEPYLNYNSGNDFQPTELVSKATSAIDEDVKGSQVVWLMSFPNSGTSYTLTNVEHMTQRSTASNYAEGYEVCFPVRPELVEQGPFLHNLEMPIATSTLTKTHCGGYCTDCRPSGYALDVNSFESACVSGFKNDHGNKVATMYSTRVPSKAIHLIRNPFDNIVARMHLRVRKDLDSDGNARSDQTLQFADSREGIAAWCKYLDGSFTKEVQETPLFSDQVREAWANVSCRSEWFRWVQWHNLALQVTARLDQQRSGRFPVHLLYYEDYTTKYNATVSELLEFMDLEAQTTPLEFIPGKTYMDFFPVDEQRAATRFVRRMATPELWKLIAHYFEGILE